MTKELPAWMKTLSQEKNNEMFSQLCNDYFKLATMRCMQKIRKDFNVPPGRPPSDIELEVMQIVSGYGKFKILHKDFPSSWVLSKNFTIRMFWKIKDLDWYQSVEAKRQLLKIINEKFKFNKNGEIEER